ncbi:MAG TPA: HD domain-containing phosphohydrolase [Anaerolineales bacterium]|nr:HD domain-containing phosphohydrolase [Anaerolineales bacterium]
MAETTILVVEDNSLLREGLVTTLESDGLRVLHASNGLEAIEILEQEIPDLILSDIGMPKMDGYALFDHIREHPRWIAIPFIFLTARDDREDIYLSKRLGAEDYLVKPVSRLELITTVRARLARNQQLALAQLQQAYQSSLIVMSNAIELRDQYTRGHVERVMAYSVALASQLGFRNGTLNALRLGSILHDIGKIYIRESILRKPGPLNEQEWVEMRQHPIVGADLIRNIPFLSPAIPIIRHHHERWDGSGYPDRLVGEEIPFLARVVAIADSLDAMLIARVYSRPFSPEEARTEIIHLSGKHYDPKLVKAFVQAWPEIFKRIQSAPAAGPLSEIQFAPE